MPKRLKEKRMLYKKLKNSTWSEFIFLFNKKHNKNLKTKIGKVNVKTKNYTKQKS